MLYFFDTTRRHTTTSVYAKKRKESKRTRTRHIKYFKQTIKAVLFKPFSRHSVQELSNFPYLVYCFNFVQILFPVAFQTKWVFTLQSSLELECVQEDGRALLSGNSNGGNISFCIVKTCADWRTANRVRRLWKTAWASFYEKQRLDGTHTQPTTSVASGQILIQGTVEQRQCISLYVLFSYSARAGVGAEGGNNGGRFFCFF